MANSKSDYLLLLDLDNRNIEIIKIYDYEGSIGIYPNNKFIYIDTKLDKKANPKE